MQQRIQRYQDLSMSLTEFPLQVFVRNHEKYVCIGHRREKDSRMLNSEPNGDVM